MVVIGMVRRIAPQVPRPDGDGPGGGRGDAVRSVEAPRDPMEAPRRGPVAFALVPPHAAPADGAGQAASEGAQMRRMKRQLGH